jgi:formamidopyrimidine-DNA glycosylase
MPELPEVETISRYLREGRGDQPPIPGREISRAELLWSRTLAEPSSPEFLARIGGQVVQQVGRRGKFLQLTLSHDHLVLHLRMSGDIWVEPAAAPLHPHHRLLLFFNDGWRLAFNDARKFGRAWLVTDPAQLFAKLGPEPLSSHLHPDEFHHRLLGVRRQLKPLLLDQSFLAGLGNIYSDEALHLACLNPLLPSNRLSLQQAATLLQAIRLVLQAGIAAHGASIDWVYRGGEFQNNFRVYQRTGLPCPVCGTPIQRIVLGQRGTHFCPSCQPREGKQNG